MKKNANRVEGLLVSTGHAEGFIVHHKPGDVFLKSYKGLVVVIHDLDASEVIAKLKKPNGVIAEVGGVMAHGAVLLREYKIPAFILGEAFKILPPKTKVSFGESKYINFLSRVASRIKMTRRLKIWTQKRRGQWTMIKPVRREDMFSQYTHSWALPGFLATPKVLLGKNDKAEMFYTKTGIWVKNHPLPSEIAELILAKPTWLNKQLKIQQRLFTKLITWEKLVKADLLSGKKYTIEECWTYIKRCQNWFTTIRPYIFLFADGIEPLQREFTKLAKQFLKADEVADLFSLVGRSAYAEAIKKYKIREPRPGKASGKFTYQPFTIVPAKARWQRKVKLPPYLRVKFDRQPKLFKKKFGRYLEVMPVMVEINDQMCYVPRQVISAIPIRFLEIIAKTAVELGMLKERNDIFKFKIEDIDIMLKKMLTNQPRLKRERFSVEP